MDIKQVLEGLSSQDEIVQEESELSVINAFFNGNPRKAWQVGRAVLPDDEQTRAMIETVGHEATPVIVVDLPKGGA